MKIAQIRLLVNESPIMPIFDIILNMNIWITLISGLLIIIGTIGAVLPFLPGLPVAYLGLILFAIFSKTVSVWALVVFGILTVLTILLDVFGPGLSAKGKKASNQAVMGAIIGAIFGIIVLGPVGIVLGPFLGAFLGEMSYSANTAHSFRIALASLWGLLITSVFKLIVGVSMFIYFLFAAI